MCGPVMFMVNIWPVWVIRSVFSSETMKPDPSLPVCLAGNVRMSNRSGAATSTVRVTVILVSSLMLGRCPRARSGNRLRLIRELGIGRRRSARSPGLPGDQGGAGPDEGDHIAPQAGDGVGRGICRIGLRVVQI